jgi:hypothetical protein
VATIEGPGQVERDGKLTAGTVKLDLRPRGDLPVDGDATHAVIASVQSLGKTALQTLVALDDVDEVDRDGLSLNLSWENPDGSMTASELLYEGDEDTLDGFMEELLEALDSTGLYEE